MDLPVNPVDFMGDIAVKEGYRTQPKNDKEVQKAFEQYLVEEIFVRDFFSNENSIYKPDPEDSVYGSSKSNIIYSEIMKKELAKNIVENNVFPENLGK